MKRFYMIIALLVSVLAAKAELVQIDGIRYDINQKSKVAIVTNKTGNSDGRNSYSGDVVIPEKVKFEGVDYSVTSIGDGAFAWCTGLTSIDIPNSVTSIGGDAFSGCSGVKELIYEEGCTTALATGLKSITSVTIPSSVTSIEKKAFYNCSGLTSVTILATTPPTIDSSTFSTYGELHVLPGCGDAYRAAKYWNKFKIIEDAVDAITLPTADKQSGVKDIYKLGGSKRTTNGKGVQIIRYNDGTVRKVMK